MADSTVATWLALLKAGNAQAQQEVWDAFFPELVTVARTRLAGMRRTVADEEDVALSVLQSFFKAAQENRFPDLRGRDSLWRLLSWMTQRKAVDLIRHTTRQKRRGGGESACLALEFGEPSSRRSRVRPMEQLAGKEPSPDLAMIFIEELRTLLEVLSDPMRKVALQKLDGYSNEEIAQNIDCSLATVERRLKMIREIWSKHGRSATPQPGDPRPGPD